MTDDNNDDNNSKKYYVRKCSVCNHEIFVLDKTDDICCKCSLEKNTKS